MLETQRNPDKQDMNKEAIGSLLIGIVSMIGIFLVGNGTVLSAAGLLLGVLSLREAKKLRQKGAKLAAAGLILNCLGIVSLFF